MPGAVMMESTRGPRRVRVLRRRAPSSDSGRGGSDGHDGREGLARCRFLGGQRRRRDDRVLALSAVVAQEPESAERDAQDDDRSDDHRSNSQPPGPFVVVTGDLVGLGGAEIDDLEVELRTALRTEARVARGGCTAEVAGCRRHGPTVLDEIGPTRSGTREGHLVGSPSVTDRNPRPCHPEAI